MAYVATVTIQSAQVTADLTDFPLLVSLADLPAAFWSTVANGGGDIRVFKADGVTELPREVASCDTVTDTGELWIKFSGVLSSTTNTEIQIHADGVAADYAVTDPMGRNAVWSGYAAVYHLGDVLPGVMVDSTGNGYGLSDSDWVSGDSTTGQISAAVDKSSLSRVFEVDGTITAPSGSDYTYQLWFNPSAWNGSNPGLWRSRTLPSTESNGNEWNIFQGASGRPWVRMGGADLLKPASGAGASLSTMAMQVFRVSSATSASWFLDGVKEHTASHTTATPSFSIKRFGYQFLPEETALGIYDEMRFTLNALSDDWITTEYNNQSAPATFYTATAVGAATITLTSITPTTGPSTGGTTVTMTGTGFEAGTVPKFNGVDATSVVIVSPTELTCVTPAL